MSVPDTSKIESAVAFLQSVYESGWIGSEDGKWRETQFGDVSDLLSSLLEENKRMKEAFGEVFFEWLHLHDVADSMDLAACVEIEDHEKFEAACHRARSALKEVGNE